MSDTSERGTARIANAGEPEAPDMPGDARNDQPAQSEHEPAGDSSSERFADTDVAREPARDTHDADPATPEARPRERRFEQERAPLMDGEVTEFFHGRWITLQAEFVDEPRRSVEQADELVAELMQRLAEVFARERETLEGQWSAGEDVSTEELRVALRRYRSFFDRLLST